MLPETPRVLQEKFRLAVIDKRLSHDADVAAREYARLAEKLAQDPRLQALLKA